MRLVDLYGYRPLVLPAYGGAAGDLFRQIMADTPVLLAFDSLDDQAGATLATGTATNDNELYAFDPALPPPTETRVRGDGTRFESEPVDVFLRGDMAGLVVPVDLRLHDAVVAGEFTTSERCSIGQAKATPGWRFGATLRATIPVAEANDTRIRFGDPGYSLCQMLAGIFLVHGGDITCNTLDQSEWPFQPDAMIPDGEGGMEPAWTIDVDVAATAVRMAGRE